MRLAGGLTNIPAAPRRVSITNRMSGLARHTAYMTGMAIHTSPNAENRVMSSVSRGAALFFRSIEHRVGVRVIVHFHLPVHLHIFASGSYIVEQCVDSLYQILTLLLEDVELR